MGFRAWLTPVKTKKEFKELSTHVKKHEDAYGINYVVGITSEDCPFTIGEAVVAWSSDCNFAMTEMENTELRDRTLFLDNFLQSFPEWHTGAGPGNYGDLFKSDKEVLRYLKE